MVTVSRVPSWLLIDGWLFALLGVVSLVVVLVLVALAEFMVVLV